VVMRSDSAESIKAMLRARLGISILFVWNINADLRSKALAVIKTEHAPAGTGHGADTPQGRFHPASGGRPEYAGNCGRNSPLRVAIQSGGSRRFGGWPRQGRMAGSGIR
jgi:hypothetical protein